MSSKPDRSMKKRIFDFDSEDQRLMMLDICNAIYIARNISLSNDNIIAQLEKIDSLFRTIEHEEEI